MTNRRIEMKEKIFGGIIGLCIADALGTPVEFQSREALAHNPVTDMLGYGTHSQPPSTWSDDTSLTLCLLDSLTGGLDYTDIMNKCSAWNDFGEYTPHGESFGIGRTTKNALLRFAEGTEPLMCGGQSERNASNGSLMKILPLAFYLHSLYGDDFSDRDESFEIIHNVSSLTHAHKRCLISCGIYISIAGKLLAGNDMERAVHHGLQSAKEYYESRSEYHEELHHFERIFSSDFRNLPQESIKSSGYVVDTLEAAIWCILNTDGYRHCVLKAVNLGGDTDTIAAIAGGLAGMGCDISLGCIPQEWMNQIARLDYIKGLCLAFYISLRRSSLQKLCSYISFFEHADPDIAFQYRPDGKFGEFLDDFHKSGIESYNYIITMHKISVGDLGSIERADFETLATFFTGCIRAEDLCSGMWSIYIRDGVFLAILRRLEVLLLADT